MAKCLIIPILEEKKYAFASWPDGYGFFDHHKGAKASPRHDAYLIGILQSYILYDAVLATMFI